MQARGPLLLCVVAQVGAGVHLHHVLAFLIIFSALVVEYRSADSFVIYLLFVFRLTITDRRACDSFPSIPDHTAWPDSYLVTEIRASDRTGRGIFSNEWCTWGATLSNNLNGT